MRFIILLILIASTTSATAQIKVETQKGADFSKYQTFFLERGQVVSLINNKSIDEKKVYQIILQTVDNEMKLRGYQLTQDSTAQLIISYVLEEADRSNLERTDPKAQIPDQSNINEVYKSSNEVSRTLIIEIEDRKQNSLWTANCTLAPSERDVYSLIESTIISAFKKFPKKGRRK